MPILIRSSFILACMPSLYIAVVTASPWTGVPAFVLFALSLGLIFRGLTSDIDDKEIGLTIALVSGVLLSYCVYLLSLISPDMCFPGATRYDIALSGLMCSGTLAAAHVLSKHFAQKSFHPDHLSDSEAIAVQKFSPMHLGLSVAGISIALVASNISLICSDYALTSYGLPMVLLPAMAWLTYTGSLKHFQQKAYINQFR